MTQADREYMTDLKIKVLHVGFWCYDRCIDFIIDVMVL